MPEEKAWAYMVQDADEAGYRHQRAIDCGTQVVVGVNCFRVSEEALDEIVAHVTGEPAGQAAGNEQPPGER